MSTSSRSSSAIASGGQVTDTWLGRGARDRGAALRGGPADVPAAGRSGRAAAAASGMCASTQGSRRATRSALALRPDDREADRARANPGTRHSTGSREALAETVVEGVTTNLPFLRWLVDHPLVRAGETTTAFLVEHPPLSEPPLHAHPAGPGVEPSASTSPPPARAAARRRRRGSASTAARASESSLTAPMPGTVIRVLVGEGDARRGTAAV